jgi:hypothetical protein
MESLRVIDIQKIVDAAIERRNQVRAGGRDKDYFHVSDAGTCYRKRYLKRLGVEPQVPIPTASLRKMYAGDAGHVALQELLKWDNSLFASEGNLGDGQHILGHFDGIIMPGLRQKVMLEIKTVEKWSLSHIVGSCSCKGTPKEHAIGPKPEHILQAKTYWVFGRDQYTSLDQMTVAYFKREDFGGVQFDYQWQDEVREEVSREWLPLLKAWAAKVLPACTCNLDYGGAGVNYCRYQDGQGGCCSEDLLKTLVTETKGDK